MNSIENQLDYWRQQLADLPPLLELPTDRPRTVTQSSNRAHHTFRLRQSLTESLRIFNGQLESSLFMTLLSSFATLLFRYSGQSDILIGSPTVNRNCKEVNLQTNLLVNALILRLNLSGNPTFKQLLSQVRQVILEAQKHQNIPFEQLVEVLQLEQTQTHHPLFQVLFVWRNTSDDPLTLSGVNLTNFEKNYGFEQLDLTLEMYEQGAEIVGKWNYNADLFDEPTIQRITGHLQTLLEGVVANPFEPIETLPLLTESERHQLLVVWNETTVEHLFGKYVHSLFEEQVARCPDTVAVVFGEVQLTYHELNQRANQLAHYLMELGVGPEVLVGVFLERSPEAVVTLLAVFKAGGVYLPLDPTYPQERLAFMLEDTQVSLLLTQQKWLANLPPHQARVICLDTEQKVIARKEVENPCNQLTGDRLAYIIYTSGSTGKPKGVLIEHRSLTNMIQSDNLKLNVKPGDRLTHFSSLSFDASISEILCPLCAGARLYVLTPEQSLPGPALLQFLKTEAITHFFLTPSVLAVLSGMEDDFPALKVLLTFGEACSPDLVTRWSKGRHFYNVYGPTEFTIAATIGECTDASSPPPIGRPYNNTQAYLLDKHLQPVPIGIPGELYLGGVQLARGYLNQPALTEQKFIPNPFALKENSRLYKTGDLAYYRPDGNLVFVGRVDEMVKIRGLRVELGEIETVLNKHPAVQQAVVVARKDTSDRNQHILAYVVPQTSMPTDRDSQLGHETELGLTSRELRHFLNSKLPAFMVPATFTFLSKLPLTPSGKVDRRALPIPNLDCLDTRELVAPRTQTEETIATIWREILQLEQVGIYENFFELGGHSLLATQVVLRLQKAFHLDIPIRTVFEQPTIARLAEIVASTTFKGIQSEHPIVRVPREQEIFPSFAQERLWFLNQLEGPNATYNIFDAWFIEGALNITALKQSLTEIVHRHESLRTTFAAVKGQPTQILHLTSTVKLEVVELLALPEVEKQAAVQRLVTQESQYPFDLEHDSLLRVTLLQTAPEEHYLLLNMHHIISDGWSVGVFIQELSALYKAFIQGEPVSWTALPLQYADFAHWQRGWLQGEVLSNQLNYWKAQLADAPPLLELATDHQRPPVQSFKGASHKFTLPKRLSEKLKAFSSRSGTTLFMVLQAAFTVLLHRYSSQEQILVGTASANRNRLETEPLIGFFVNMLVLRFNLSGNPTFREFLFQVRQVALEAYNHQDLPFEQLVDALQPKRTLSHSPLFQVAFGWRDAQLDLPKLFGLTVSRLEVEKVTAKFDLTLLMEEDEQGLRGEWEYSTDLFEPDTIQRMNGHFQTLLESILSNPQQRVSSLPLLTEAERQQLLFEWNNTETEYPQDKCIHQLFEKQVELLPDAVAVIFEGEQLTYRELNARANQLAHHLQTLGVGAEVLVGICVERSLEMVVGLLAILKTGGAYVPLDTEYPKERLAFIIEDTQISVLLTTQKLADNVPKHQARVVCFDTDAAAIALLSEQNPTAEVTSDNLAYVIYTSGSTGKPKGVAVHHRAVNRLAINTNYINIEAKDVIAQASNYAFDAATFEIWGALLHGARLVGVSKELALSPKDFAAFMRSQGISVLFLTTALFNQIAQEVPSAFNSLRHLLFGGEAVDPKWVKEVLNNGAPQRLLHVYGPTENTTFTSWYLVQDVPSGATTIPIGRPIANTQIYLLDSQLQPVGVGVPGEIYIGGDGLAREYLNRPDLSKEKFIPNPFSTEPHSRLYKTGDLARYLSDGNIEFLGRIDNQVKVRGFRIELGEIEAVLTQHPDVLKAVVIVREDNPGNKYLAAYLVPELYAAAPPKSSELRSFLKTKLPDYMIPGTFVFLEAMPLTPNGKVDRSALPAPDSASFALSAVFVPPQSPLEHDLVNIWREVLGTEQIGTQDDFFELGGHSLLATQIISRVREHFHIVIPLRSLFENPTVAGLAQRLDTLQKATDVFVTSEVVSCFPNVEDYEEGEL